MSVKKPASQPNPGCLMLFGLPFAAVGVGMGVWLFSGLLAHWRMQTWVETPAKIVRAKLECDSSGDGGDSYRATAEYTYQFDERQYTGRRVGILGGSDNIGSFQQNAHRRLSECQKSGRPFRCYVNPVQPSEAVLFRDLRWEMVAFQMVFVLGFGGAGFGLLVFGLVNRRKTKREQGLATVHPEKPWLWKKAWADGKIRSSTGTIALFLVAFASFWNVISWPIVFGLLSGPPDRHPRWVYVFLAFPAIGVILILCAIVSLLRWRKYGRSVFDMSSVPGVIGGQLAGVIRVPTKVAPDEGFRLSLNCVQKSLHGEGSSENVLWQDEQTIAHELLQTDPEQSAIPVLFQIPYDCRPTDDTDAKSQTIWRLAVSAKTPGLDLSTSFDVPVFKTAESDPNFVVDRSLIADYTAPEDPDRDLHDAGVIKTDPPSGEGFRLVFPMARAPFLATMVTMTAILFGGVPFFIYYMDSGFSLGTIPFMVIFGLIGLVLLVLSADVWFYRSVVDVSKYDLTITGGLFGLGRTQRIEPSDVDKIVPNSRMHSGDGQHKKVYYDIDVVRKTGKKVTAGKRVPSKRLAESVIRQIEQALGK